VTDQVALFARLHAETDAAVASRTAAARAEAEAIRQHARDEIAHRRALALEQFGREADLADAAAADETRQRTRRDLLVARADALTRIFAAAEEALNGCAGATVPAERLASLLSTALPYLPAGDAVVRAPSSIVATVRKVASSSGREGLTVMPDETVGLGLIVVTADRRLAVDATFVRALRRDRARLAISIAREVEGEPSR